MKNKVKHNTGEDKWKCMQNIISEIWSNKKEKCKKEEKLFSAAFTSRMHIYYRCFICLVIFD